MQYCSFYTKYNIGKKADFGYQIEKRKTKNEKRKTENQNEKRKTKIENRNRKSKCEN